MTLPFALPDWVPWWLPILVVVPALLYAVVFLFMPFIVIGLRGRLDSVEARLDEIQGEIRSLAFRLPEPLRGAGYENRPEVAPTVARSAERGPVVVRPPIPPAARFREAAEEPDDTGENQPRPRYGARHSDPTTERPRPRRSEPRLDWPG